MDKFFIVGCPRSGTTMVQQALNRHPGVVIPPETKFFFSFFGHPRARQARHVARLNADLGIRLPAPARAVRTAAEGRAYYDAMARQYVARVRKPGAVAFGEKTPEHTGLLPRIRRLFPGAKILVLCRDGRDVAASLTRVPWMSSNLYANFAVWLYYHWVVSRAARDAGPDLYVVRYEDIVADPARELGAVLRFLGLPYEPAVAEGWGNREGIPERELPWKARALQPITAGRVGAFRRDLTDEQIGNLERLGRHVLPSLGYPLLTGGNRALAPGFLLELAGSLLRLAGRLPWTSILRELGCRLGLDRPALFDPPSLAFPAPTPLDLPMPACTPAYGLQPG
jgi:hypothetical protein